MDDASLDDFLDASDDADGDDPADDQDTASGSGGNADEPGPSAVESGTVEPAVSTYGWSDGPRACADCGADVERRWRDEAGLVCSECKEW